MNDVAKCQPHNNRYIIKQENSIFQASYLLHNTCSLIIIVYKTATSTVLRIVPISEQGFKVPISVKILQQAKGTSVNQLFSTVSDRAS